MSYQGNCTCETICFEVEGSPLFTQYCHCNKCRQVAEKGSNPLNKEGYAFTAAYLTKNFAISKGKDKLHSEIFNNAELFFCQKCNDLIYGISTDENKQLGIGISANAFQFKDNNLPMDFKPVRHIWYENRIKDFSDDLPKYKDAPLDQGGTDEIYSPSITFNK